MGRQRPILLRDQFLQVLFEFDGIRIFRKSEPLRKTDHMRVASDTGRVVGVPQHHISGLATDSRQRHQLFQRFRNYAAEITLYFSSRALNELRLTSVKTDGADVVLQFRERHAFIVFWRFIFGEERFRDFIYAFVGALGG